MIDIKLLRDNSQAYKDSAKLRGVSVDIDKLLELDKRRTELIGQIEGLRAKLNVKGKPTPEQLVELQEAKKELEPLEKKFSEVDGNFQKLLLSVPNLHSNDTPVGKDDSGNVVLRKVGQPPKFDFEPMEHWELGAKLGVIDNERAAEVAGGRFTYIKGGLAKLQFALISFVTQNLTDQATIAEIISDSGVDVSVTPFIPVVPPVMIRRSILERMARLDPIEDRYRVIPGDTKELSEESDNDLFLVGSAEHTLGPLHMDEVIPENKLPIRYLGYSTAFRGEAGSYGKDVRGILRVHQFDKLEMESFCMPDTSEAEQDFFVAVQEFILQSLELPYQVVAICTGDMGDPDYRQMDIETWMPGQNKYRETHTADLMTDYQSRRLRIKVKRENGSVELVHMNDATACAVGRLLIAIMENYQTAEGKIRIPKALQLYYGSEFL